MDKKVTTKSKPLPQIDLKALEYNLSLSVDKRLLQHQSAFETVSELKKALAEVKTLSGMLPICANCKKIRDDKDYWNRIEIYIGKHSEAEFSHGICPECTKELYPEFELSPGKS